MKRNKILKTIFNVAIGIAAVVFAAFFFDMLGSVKYANRETEDPSISEMGVFEYRLEHKAFGEILKSYHTDRMGSMEPIEGCEKIYALAGYADNAFLRRVYEEKKDVENENICRERCAGFRNDLEPYAHAADEIDEILAK
ncbi:MAG: hypothetical protein K6E50_13330 [Lachnospiraceae bacterium]|nr:hypothetical protein [Lachnospiraceae bacterium]